MADILKQKKFPLNYPKDVLDVINAMSFEGGETAIVGSSSLASQLYSGDYDLNCKIGNGTVTGYAKGLQHKVSQLLIMPNVYVGELKAGVIEEWRIIPQGAHIKHGRVVGVKRTDCVDRVRALERAGVISSAEAIEFFKLLKHVDSPEGFLMAEKEMRIHTLRWTPHDVLAGRLRIRDGRIVTLEEAISMPALVKLDVVALVDSGVYTEFSCIYTFSVAGRVLNRAEEPNLRENLLYYFASGNYFKMAKRMFSICKIERKFPHILNKLNEILNSDLGLLYNIISDCNTILYLLENEANLPLNKITYELDQMRGRLASVTSVDVNTVENLKSILKMEGFPSTVYGRQELAEKLSALIDSLEKRLSEGAKKELTKAGMLPLFAFFLP